MPLIRTDTTEGARIAAPLTAQQKKFNTNIQRIARLRKRLEDWKPAIAAYTRRFETEYQPLWRQHHELLCDLVRFLNQERERKGLSKQERETLHDTVAEMSANLMHTAQSEAEKAEMEAIRARYVAPEYDAAQKEASQARMRAEASELFGVDMEDADFSSPEAILRHALEQLDQEIEAEEAQAQASGKQKQPSARERKEQEAQQQATQSLREIYRKLASTLHPDREPDPVERERKTALMQRVNTAYEEEDLLALLQLQLEAEQIDAQHMAGLSDERLKPYNRLLAEQIAELQSTEDMVVSHFCFQFHLDPTRKYQPSKLPSILRAQIQEMREMRDSLAEQLSLLRNSTGYLKRWLQHEYAASQSDAVFEITEEMLEQMMGKQRR